MGNEQKATSPSAHTSHLDKEDSMESKTVFIKDAGARVTPGVQAIRIGDLPGEAPYDPDVFGAFLRNMKGTKSAREFADEADLSESFVSKAVSGRQMSRPSKRTLLKLLRAKTEEPVDRRELAKAAGYEQLELEADTGADAEDTENVRPLSAAAVITRYYGEDHFTAMSELQRALAEHGLKGDISSCFYREPGYFEITDMMTGQVYVGINAYLKRAENGEEDTEIKIDENAVFSIAFAVGSTYNRVIMSEGAKDKIVYILTDNERVYEGCRSVLPKDKTKATVVVLTDDHQGFRKEDVLSYTEKKPTSLVD